MSLVDWDHDGDMDVWIYNRTGPRLRLMINQTTSPGSTREEFRALTEVFEREGTLEPNETLMIRNVLDFRKVKVDQVMIPLSKVTAVPREMPLSVVLSLARQTEFDQFPVIGPNGDLIGIVDVLELLRDRASLGTVELYRRNLVRAQPDEPARAN